MAKKTITFTAEVPYGVPNYAISQYVVEAVESMGGNRRPPGSYGPDDEGDPLFGSIQVKSIKVRGPKRRKKKIELSMPPFMMLDLETNKMIKPKKKKGKL